MAAHWRFDHICCDVRIHCTARGWRADVVEWNHKKLRTVNGEYKRIYVQLKDKGLVKVCMNTMHKNDCMLPKHLTEAGRVPAMDISPP
jgi:hypothetical protein